MRALSVSVVAGALLGGLLTARAELANGIMAVVHDSVITFHQVDASIDVPFLYTKYGGETADFQKEYDKLRQQNLEVLIDHQLVLHEFATAGYSLPESALDEMVQEEITSQYSDRRTWAKTLQARGESFEEYRKQVRDRYIERALIAKNIQQSIIISPHKVELYYQQHREEYKVPEQVKLRRINLPQSQETNAPSAEKMAEEIVSQLKTGAKFADLQTLYSQNKQEGEWYDMPEGLWRPLADIATSLQPGQHTGVLSRSVGENDYWVCQYTNGQPVLGRHYVVNPKSFKVNLAAEQKFNAASPATNLPPVQEFFLVQLEDKHTAHYKPLSEMREQIENELSLAESARLKKQWIEKLKKKTFVRIFPGG